MTAHRLREARLLLPPETWSCDAASFLRVCAIARERAQAHEPGARTNNNAHAYDERTLIAGAAGAMPTSSA